MKTLQEALDIWNKEQDKTKKLKLCSELLKKMSKQDEKSFMVTIHKEYLKLLITEDSLAFGKQTPVIKEHLLYQYNKTGSSILDGEYFSNGNIIFLLSYQNNYYEVYNLNRKQTTKFHNQSYFGLHFNEFFSMIRKV